MIVILAFHIMISEYNGQHKSTSISVGSFREFTVNGPDIFCKMRVRGTVLLNILSFVIGPLLSIHCIKRCHWSKAFPLSGVAKWTIRKDRPLFNGQIIMLI